MLIHFGFQFSLIQNCLYLGNSKIIFSVCPMSHNPKKYPQELATRMTQSVQKIPEQSLNLPVAKKPNQPFRRFFLDTTACPLWAWTRDTRQKFFAPPETHSITAPEVPKRGQSLFQTAVSVTRTAFAFVDRQMLSGHVSVAKKNEIKHRRPLDTFAAIPF